MKTEFDQKLEGDHSERQKVGTRFKNRGNEVVVTVMRKVGDKWPQLVYRVRIMRPRR